MLITTQTPTAHTIGGCLILPYILPRSSGEGACRGVCQRVRAASAGGSLAGGTRGGP